MTNWMNEWCTKLAADIINISNRTLDMKKQILEKKYENLKSMFENLGGLKSSRQIRKAMIDVEETYFEALDLIAGRIEDQNETQMQEKEKDYISSARLGKINIPQFSGDINEWVSFHDIFKSLIHDCKYLSNVEKMYSLENSLKGEAKKFVQHLKLTDMNYNAAFDILKKRYENKSLLFSTQVDILLDQPKVNSGTSTSIK